MATFHFAGNEILVLPAVGQLVLDLFCRYASGSKGEVPFRSLENAANLPVF